MMQAIKLQLCFALKIFQDRLHQLWSNTVISIRSKNTECHDIESTTTIGIIGDGLYSCTDCTYGKSRVVGKFAQVFIGFLGHFAVEWVTVGYGEACLIDFLQLRCCCWVLSFMHFVASRSIGTVDNVRGKTHWAHISCNEPRWKELLTCSILSELIIPKSTESLPILIRFYLYTLRRLGLAFECVAVAL